MFHITEVDKNHSALSGLVSELDAFQSQLYPAESNHCLDFSTVDEEGIRCVIAHDAAGFAAGCGAVLLQGGGFGEIKRLYIRPAYRGRRLGEQLIARLERLAAADLCHQLRLETGIHQQPAIALYRRCGYARCDAFPPYRDDPLSVFMSKSL
ncbi:GNAT family N-acetyltransferase [Sodalis praecaptivus]|uniref:GNAT family N-acetyltransferase n=1 Tax=Sodalis praecaptivus TaxID=1239307 RepID=UPI0027FFFBD5|nr:GNAT family N-acetyltransferase [Sodalis praecaptivus]CAJ0996864.1 putative N-acetyltransferase YsnE [Sodalis praecaptivus]